MLDGFPLVLFRAARQIHALADCCPHRGAPLSAGRIKGHALECPYHGWCFDGSGRCTSVPGSMDDTPRVSVPVYAAMEKDGLIFITSGSSSAPPYTHVLSDTKTVVRIVEGKIVSNVAEVADNILDAAHTHFVHKGLLRGLSARRQRVEVHVTGGDDWVEARYEGETRQNGIVSRLLEGERTVSVGRFKAPGIAELEFWGAGRIRLATTFHLAQTDTGQVQVLGILAGPKATISGHLLAATFMPFFSAATRQDRDILEKTERNKRIFGHHRPYIGPIDIMRPHIDAILAGDRPTVADAPVNTAMLL
jgi:phenylpropionate dioxygenase-like ring-hydroxylating dioxygenase large terminal subunit